MTESLVTGHKIFNPNFALELNDRRKTLQEKGPNANRLRRGLTPIVATSCDVSALRADFANAKSGFNHFALGMTIFGLITISAVIARIRAYEE